MLPQQLFKNAINFAEEARNLIGAPRPFLSNTHIFPICLITSTPDEFNYIRSYLFDVKEFEFDNDDAIIYYSGLIKTNDSQIKIIIPHPIAFGIEAAVSVTTKTLSLFSPKTVIMTGICAGNKKVTKIGDLIIAEKSVNYNEVVEIGSSQGSRKKFMQNVQSASTNLTLRAQAFLSPNKLTEIKSRTPLVSKFAHQLKAHNGLMVTGSSLVRSKEKMEEINSSYHGVKAMDMETNAFYFAVQHLGGSKPPNFLSIKAVSDFGDDTKFKDISSQDRHDYALSISTNACIQFICENARFLI